MVNVIMGTYSNTTVHKHHTHLNPKCLSSRRRNACTALQLRMCSRFVYVGGTSRGKHGLEYDSEYLELIRKLWPLHSRRPGGAMD